MKSLDLAPLRELIERIVDERVAIALANHTVAHPEPGERLTVAEAAELARVTPGCVRRWIRSGRLAASGAGKLLRVHRADLDAMLRGGSGELSDDELDAIARRIG
ncbi:MAG: helix-turn-helix domain-containing protein [Deltaproteobacteria bacterium]|nr:helix-turn-helix domain-containing protein [Deltaproteobacteria bacterium]